ncbi:Probably peptidyl-prolyl CIS-trans isomerase C [gamma proteobacterium HdN1]|nr:Probably peptidyl-prolyl CIS-trans isomerase C [gamma proteobacterium HdN1]
MSAVNQFNPSAKAMLVSVNGVEIPEAAIKAEMAAEYADEERVKAWEKAATALVIRELLLQQASLQGLEGDEAECIDTLLSRNIEVPTADESYCRRFFEENPARFRSPDLIEARHILFAAAPGDWDARDLAQEEAVRIIERLRATPEQFAEYANEYSACPSREEGGSLGQLSKGSTVPEFESAIFGLPTGLHGTPIESRYGYHVVWIDHRVDGQPLPYEHVKEGVARYLEDNVFRQGLSQYLQLLAGSATITGIDIKAASSPLLQ